MALENGAGTESESGAIPIALPVGSPRSFRHVFILESRAWWPLQGVDFDPARDLLLTFDHGLKRDVEAVGGIAVYLDALCEPAFMHASHFPMYRFFHDWHRDDCGRDLFRCKDIDFGFAFRLDIWNDLTFYVRLRLSIEALKGLTYVRLYTGLMPGSLTVTFEEAGLPHTPLEVSPNHSQPVFYFPVHRWMDERLRRVGLRKRARDAFIATHGIVMNTWDRLMGISKSRRRCFVQQYHPTRALRQALQNDSHVQLVQEVFSLEPGLRKFFLDRLIPVYGNRREANFSAAEFLSSWRLRRSARLLLPCGLDITAGVNRVIESRVQQVLPDKIRDLLSVIRYMRANPIDLVVLIGNIGQLAMLVDCVARAWKIPSYLIINGMLWGDYLDEGKYATVINAYGPSIRDHYFRGMDNVLCLGDPRMDAYASASPRQLNRTHPTITIGTSGFNNIDLTSYLAVEFDFMEEVLGSLTRLRAEGKRFEVVIKVRPNGYRRMYRDFCAEYFPDLRPRILDQAPMREVLEQTDFYISIYSQTLLEAAALGIPSVYHKVDCETIDPPFDDKSELVTTHDSSELAQAIRDFLAGSERFDSFIDRSVLERYLGPLDGQSLARNLAYVRQLLGVEHPQC